MNYQDVVDLVRQISNAINPSGHFVHGRNTDGSLDYDYPFPQIHLLPVQTTYDVVNDVKDHTLIVMFWEQDSPESSNDEREAKIAAMDQLSDLFLAAIYNNTVFQVGDVLKTPEYRQLAGTASGYGLSFSLITKVDCDEEPFQLCPDAVAVLRDTDATVISTTNIPSGSTQDITAPDAIAILEDTNGNVLSTTNILSNDTDVIIAPDAVVNLRNTDNILISTNNYLSNSSQDLIAPDATAVLKDTANNILLTELIPSNDIEDITAPDASYELTIGGNPVDSGNILSGGFDSIAIDAFIPACDPVDIEVNGTPEGSIASGSTLDIQLTDGVNPVTPDSVTQVGNTLTIEVPSTSPAGWQRPSDWLPMPTVLITDDTFVGLYAVFPSGNNFAAFRFTTSTGDYQVDWGDGTVDTVASNVTAEHTYDYSTYDPTNTTLTTRGYKQAIIVVTPLTGNLSTCNFQLRRTTIPAQNQAYATGFLDCILSMPNASSGSSITFGGTTVRHSYVERFQALTIGGCTSMQAMFQNCSSLQTVPLFNTGSVTNMLSMFNGCSSLQTVPLFNTASVTSMQSMFNNCFSLQTVPLFNTGSVTTMQAMFQNCYSLQTVPLFNTGSVTNMLSMFNGCNSLQTVPLFNTGSVINMGSMFTSCNSLQTVPLFNTGSVTTMQAMFQNCSSLQTVPLFNTGSVTNMVNMFTSCNSFDRTDIICRVSITFNNCQLSRNEIVNIFNNLLDRTSLTSASISITGNWGVGALTAGDIAIATAKNWTVTT